MKNALGSFLLTATLLGSTGGCVVRASGRVAAPPPVAVVEVDEEPPPPRAVVVETRPGFIFIEGRWFRRGGRALGARARRPCLGPRPLGPPRQPPRLDRGLVAGHERPGRSRSSLAGCVAAAGSRR